MNKRQLFRIYQETREEAGALEDGVLLVGGLLLILGLAYMVL